MRIACVAFTKIALELARAVCAQCVEQGDTATLSCPERLADGDDVAAIDDVSSWARNAWEYADALLFVSACGIAVRAIAPLVHDKYRDPAVVCLDESASYVVSLLSGHAGGANDLARRVGHLCGAQAVVTTATDVHGLFAVDAWAREQGLVLLDSVEAKLVSAALLEGEEVGFASDVPVEGSLPTGVVAGTCKTGFSVSYDADKRPFEHTLRLVPQTVVVGVGCKRDTTAQAILELVDACLNEAHVAPRAVCALATIDVKAHEQGLIDAAARRGWDLRFYGADELAAVPGEFAASEFVRQTVGVDNVCERAACAEGATLLHGKQSARGVTVALAATDPHLSFALSTEAGSAWQMGAEPSLAKVGFLWPNGFSPALPSAPRPGGNELCQGGFAQVDKPHVACVGLGPGGAEDLTLRAHEALQSAQVIVGYTTYVNLIRAAYPYAEFVTTGMHGEVQRCRMALERAASGEHVAVVCSGDPGVYGMAGLLLELAPEYGVSVEVIPGITAANGGAAVLGAPLMHDWCCISLSDLMTPWKVIEARLRAAAQADFCIALYNPASRGRADYLRRACDVLLEFKHADTVCGMVRNIGRDGQSQSTLTLGELRSASADMLTCVFVGNAQTKLIDGAMVTPRGYDVDATEPTRPERSVTSAARPEVLVFGGTTEGRAIAEWLGERNTCDVVYCAATEYGASLTSGIRNVTTLQGPLSRDEKSHLMANHTFTCIVDATHAFAQHISASVDELGSIYHKDVVRIVRSISSAEDGPWTVVANAEQAAEVVAKSRGNVLLTTGTKDLDVFVRAMPDYKERLYVRVLPVLASLNKAYELGIPVSHIIAMQGPFSAELNSTLMRDLDTSVMVTKQSGSAGGFEQKVEAAQACGVELVVIEKPQTTQGVSLDEARRLLEERYGL